MLTKPTLTIAFVFGFALSCFAQEQAESVPKELEVLKSSIGVWDAEVEVWAAGLDAPPTKFKGVETNRAYGNHWISSDFDSEFMGQTIKVHSIVGYDLDKKKMVGTVIDDGPYSASMTGDYDQETKAITWITHAKTPNGTPMLQKSVVTQNTPDERVLVLSVPGEEEGTFNKFMQIKFVKRK